MSEYEESHGFGRGEENVSGDHPWAVVFVDGEDEYAERMTRSLGAELSAIDGVDAVFAYEGRADARPGTKGGGAELLRFTLELAWPVVAPMVPDVVKAIHRWSKNAAKETIVIAVGDIEIRVEDGLTPEQTRELEESLGKLSE
ncbi:hypothetical protein ABH920_008734 [Catenulispora sp. EB89]|uniref:Uncharacterized protein n=1 Tax=Catenulispora pinistramenti TaxID=2705254 RepID=A0ABS5KSL1_9ACTN|nr:hypothetical protein [Catenulispora pinistramenti]MBS2549009.1 hypothetical protein [Catenulispora pinistramenti]